MLARSGGAEGRLHRRRDQGGAHERGATYSPHRFPASTSFTVFLTLPPRSTGQDGRGGGWIFCVNLLLQHSAFQFYTHLP
jgi:hypothetical protein